MTLVPSSPGPQGEQPRPGLLDGLVPAALQGAYESLLSSGGGSPADCAEWFGDPRVAEELIALGLAYMSPNLPPRLLPAEPLLAFEAAIRRFKNRLADDHDRLMTAFGQLDDLHRATTRSGPDSTVGLARVLVSREEIVGLSNTLVSTAIGDWMTLETFHYDLAIYDGAANPPPVTVRDRKVRCRSVYDSAYLSHAVGEHIIRASVEAGEEARILPNLTMKMKLADERAALVPLTSSGASAALFIQSAVLLKALHDYFEILWERAIPFGGRAVESPLTDGQREILRLLAQGLKDDAIARRTGMSLRTVRRHIGTVMERLGTSTRFAAGAAAHRRGWIE